MHYTIADLEKLTGISAARLRTLLAEVEPAVKLGKSVGYELDQVKRVVSEKYADILNFLFGNSGTASE
jgi:hypothetical protein